jgi:CheY-like chemotaxis protein
MADGFILMVDPSADRRQRLHAILTGGGWRSTGVGDGSTALRRVADGNIDLMLLDLALPGTTGLEVLDQLRGSHTEPVVPTIVLSRYTTRTVQIECLRRGAVDVLTEPYDTTILRARVRRALRHHRGQRLRNRTNAAVMNLLCRVTSAVLLQTNGQGLIVSCSGSLLGEPPAHWLGTPAEDLFTDRLTHAPDAVELMMRDGVRRRCGVVRHSDGSMALVVTLAH